MLLCNAQSESLWWLTWVARSTRSRGHSTIPGLHSLLGRQDEDAIPIDCEPTNKPLQVA